MNRKTQMLHPALRISFLLVVGLLSGAINNAIAADHTGMQLLAQRPDIGKQYMRPSVNVQEKKSVNVYPTFRRNLNVGRGTYGNLAVRLGVKAERTEFAAMESNSGKSASKQDRLGHDPSQGNRPDFLR